MRNMSFSLTTEQMRGRVKFVTRRLGWDDLKPGHRIQGCVKCMGLKPGESVDRICVIEICSTRKEVLKEITQSECVLEGFPDYTPAQFVDMFCLHNKCTPETTVNRIAFYYAEGDNFCPQCHSDTGLTFWRDGQISCEDCGFPDEDFGSEDEVSHGG